MTDTPLRRLISALSSVEQPLQAALVLLEFVLQKPKTWVLAHPEVQLSVQQNLVLESLVQRLKSGEPLPYITGTQAFFGLDFAVSPDVLIPRPETELLVEHALTWLELHPRANTALDAGTGSGCIAITLAALRPSLEVTAVDISPAALRLAQTNAAAHGVDSQVTFLLADLLPPGESRFTLVCANLPYIPTSKLSEVNTRSFEPILALDGGEDGLSLIRRLLAELPQRLCSPALVLLETEANLGQQTTAAAKANFPEGIVRLWQDLAGRERLVSIEVS